MKTYLDRVSNLGDVVNAMEIIQENEIHKQKNVSQNFLEILKLMKDYQVKINEHRFFHVAIARLMEITNILKKLSSTPDSNS